ncbi:3',5'-cyclic-AMP phosphodiesterase [Castellaniella hirudinis]|uniref:3',5'-cyclic-AMP phosphodiesterase n=1 Tax=Castellaniella hirudinis TaxID=1144617 RepID=UPI0039C4157F
MAHTPAVTTVLQLTDTHLFASPGQALLGIKPWLSLQAVLQHILDTGVRAQHVLATGDLTQDGHADAYEHFLQALAQLPWPLHGLPGNHDQPDRLQARLQAAATPVVDCGAWRLVLLDSHAPGTEGGHLAPAQLALLRQAAQVRDGRHVLVAMHHHPVPMGCAWLDTMRIDNAAELFQALDTLPAVRALVWGHVHQAHDSLLDRPGGRAPLRLLSTPSTCFQFLPHSPHFALDTQMPGYRLIHLHPDGRLDTDLIRIPALPPAAGVPQLHSAGY